MWRDRWLRHADLARRFGQIGPLFLLCALVLVASLILGGSTRAGFLSDALLQLIAIPLLLLALWRLFETPLTRQVRLVLLFCLALAVLPLLQLVPLPPWLWASLPNRDSSAELFALLQQNAPWLPISVSPHQTWLSVLSLIAPLAIFLATLLLTYRERRWLSLVILAVGTLSVFIGLLQVAQGPESPWRFYAMTNPTEAVGFFANRNHFAALGYTLVLFAAAWAANAAVIAGRAGDAKQYDTASIVAALGCFTLLVVLLAGEAMARSRAGLGLTIVALLGAFALGVSDRRVGTGFTPSKLLVVATAFSLVLGIQYALYRILERFEIDPFADARLSLFPTTMQAAKAYLPVGSGLGTFIPVYAAFEKPEDTLLNKYANHAHNDAAELWLETGLFGLVLAALFVFWFGKRTVEVWRSAPPLGASEVDWSLVRAATIIIALLLAHSFVDYPLRTGAMMAIMAFCCALLIEPLAAPEPIVEPQAIIKSKSRQRPSRALSPAPALSPTPSLSIAPSSADTPPRATGERWGSDVAWPEEWRKDRSTKPPS